MNPSSNKLLSTWLTDSSHYSESTLSDQTRLNQQGFLHALDLFKRAADNVPAYKDFLKRHSVNPKLIKTQSDFSKLPATTKDNYITYYPLNLRCWNGDMSNNHIISTSSGTTGIPHFWPRSLKHEIDGAIIHDFILNHILNLSNTPTLFINGFAMGNWIAGSFTLASVNLLSWKNFPITTLTPGYDSTAILEVVTQLSDRFDKVIISGHSPFLKELLETGVKQGVDWNKTPTTLLGTGQGVSENWRDYIIELLGTNDYYRSFINLYGSADAALMGFETPLSIELRRMTVASTSLLQRIYQDNRLPSLYQYDPRLTYFESVNHELHLTKDYGSPLVHYNIKDDGGVFTFDEIKSNYQLNKLDSLENKLNYKIAKLPFVYLFGREKFMVKVFGANIYTEHVQHALNHKQLQPHLTGRFELESSFDDNHNPILICHTEANLNTEPSQELIELVKQIFIDQVRQLNSEYNFLLSQLGERVEPIIKLHHHGHPQHFPKDKIKKTS